MKFQAGLTPLFPLIAAGLLAGSLLADGPRPNAVIIVLDDADSRDFGFTGNPFVRTPILDLLQEKGVRIENTITMSRCAPSLARLMSGQEATTNTIYYNRCPTAAARGCQQTCCPTNGEFASELLLARQLAENGYLTYAEGKVWAGDPTAWGFTHGPGHNHELWREGPSASVDRFLDSLGPDDCFVMWMSPAMPHEPWNYPAEFALDAATVATIPVPGHIRPEDADGYRQHKAHVYAMMGWLDQGLAGFITQLTSRLLHQRTWFILISTDNGFDAGYISKGSPYRKGTGCFLSFMIPLGLPNTRRGLVIDELPATTADLAPTVLDLCGLPIPAGYHGISLKEVIFGTVPPDEFPRQAVFSAAYNRAPTVSPPDPEADVFALHGLSVIRGKIHSLMWFTDEVTAGENAEPRGIFHLLTAPLVAARGEFRAFDLEADPFEFTDIAADLTPAEIEEQKEALEQWWLATGGEPLPIFSP